MEKIREILSKHGFQNIASPVTLFNLCVKFLHEKNYLLLHSLIYLDSPIINLRDSHENTLLHIACEIRDVNHTVLDNLLKHGQDINAKKWNGSTPLHVALDSELFNRSEFYINKRNEAAGPRSFHNCRFLIKKGANVEITNKNGQSPIQLAIASGCLRVAEIFLKNKIPSHVENRCLHIVQCILKENNHYCISPSHCAMLLKFSIHNKDYESVEYILSKTNINLNQNFRYSHAPDLLCHAVCQNQSLCIKILMDKGVDPNSPNKDGHLAIFLAIRDLNVEITRCLLDCGTSVNYCYRTFAPIHYAVYQQSIEIIELLLKRGAGINAISERGTPLIIACSDDIVQFNPAIVKLLMDHGADIEMRDMESHTALSYACSLGNMVAVKLLLSYGAKTEIGDTSVLHYAVLEKRHHMVKFFLEQGASINCRSAKYGTPFGLAIAHNGKQSHRRKIIFKLFVSHIAKIIATKQFISEENLMLFDTTEKVKKMSKKYLKQLKSMKDTAISPKFNFSFIDILKKDIDALGGALNQNDIRMVLSKGNYKEQFYRYSEEMEKRIKLAGHRRKLIESVSCFFQEYLNKSIPFENFLIICKNLSIEDLNNFQFTILFDKCKLE